MLQRIEPVAICDHLPFFFFCQLEHEVVWEPVSIPFDLLIEALGAYTVKHSQVIVYQDLTSPQYKDAVLDRLNWYQVGGHSPISR